jgi:hypothetical protein
MADLRISSSNQFPELPELQFNFGGNTWSEMFEIRHTVPLGYTKLGMLHGSLRIF